MKFHVWISGFVLMIYVVGCAPRLAQTPLSEEETRWQEFIKQHYPEWRPPQTVPPSIVIQDQDVDVRGDIVSRDQRPPTLIEDASFNDTPFVTPVPVAPITPIVPFQPPPVSPEAKDGRSHEIYTVQKNDTLWKIAEKYYQKGSQWTRIQEANPDLKDASKLRVGTELRIPLP